MALGSSSLRHVSPIIETVLALAPHSVVDLGMGTGKYGFLLREQHDMARVRDEDWELRLVGVEGYGQYVGDLQRRIYDDVIVSDVRDYLAQTDERFDVALALDILEHFTPEDGEAFLGAALDRARHVVILTPIAYYTQDGHLNGLEHHKSWWPSRALQAAAERLGADASVIRRVNRTMIAVFSREREAEVIADGDMRLVMTAVRDRVPEVWWSRLRGDAGPMVG